MPMTQQEIGLTWDELLDEYFFSHNLRPVTEESYRKVVRVFLSFINNNKNPDSISHKDILLWRRHLLQEKKRSAQTWNNKIAHLRALFNYAIENELLNFEKNPFNNCIVQKDKKKKKTLDRNQMIRIYLFMQQREADEPKTKYVQSKCALYPVWFWVTVLDTLRYTGMRLNQLLHIQLRDINLDEEYIDLRLEGSKTHREWRVPIVRQLLIRLRTLLMQAKNTGAGSYDYLFDAQRFLPAQTQNSNEYDPKTAQQKIRSFFRHLSKECGFSVSPHRFRHTLATELMKAPERNLQLVKDLLGHSSVSTTMEYIELRMDVASKTLEQELSLYTDICIEKDLPVLTGL